MTLPLIHSDAFVLSRAVGWLELGNASEGLSELDQISPEAQEHPDVLEVRWLLLAGKSDWAAALAVADKIVILAPDRSLGWVHKAYALRRVQGGGLEKAELVLRAAVERFPSESLIPFNLACYACQMNREEEALQWLQRAFGLPNTSTLKAMALKDEDLKPLWRRIKHL